MITKPNSLSGKTSRAATPKRKRGTVRRPDGKQPLVAECPSCTGLTFRVKRSGVFGHAELPFQRDGLCEMLKTCAIVSYMPLRRTDGLELGSC